MEALGSFLERFLQEVGSPACDVQSGGTANLNAPNTL